MKVLTFFISGSLLVVAIQFALAMYAMTNGTYHAGYAQRVVPFIFIFIISICIWLLVYIFKKITGRQKVSD
jgi:uncharacterized membrane-anchored protein